MSELNLIDCHTHTDFSPDASSAPVQMCQRAAELGLKAYAVTDHCDVNFWDRSADKSIIDYEMYGSGEYAINSISEITELKNEYPNLLCGIELGQPLQNLDKAEIIANDKRLDLIIGSQHMNTGCDDFYWIEYDKMDLKQIDKLMEDYFLQVLEICKWGKFDVLGHLTYPLRYICTENNIRLDLTAYDDIIREIFCTVIQNGKGIEINSSGLRQKYGKPFPDEKYIKMYRQLGGEILTFGSDAHCAEDIGKGVARCYEIAKDAGFEFGAYFKERKARFVKL